ncbi:hypothetical protein PLESTB_000375700 [Pleodorina starrii]|uniref:Uncharacterized protein n=1 Tax=Pleodorina starrii TaxID=330485 RepID=A0A9W6BEN0_9CHLO|nr:hypothetical protein PLESTB_000375700 [Pleodorina starrii]
MSIWLKRVGAAKGPFDLPHQAQDAIRMMIWVDNPTNLFQRTNGHLLLPTEPDQWAPTLTLETAHPGPLLPIVLETSRTHYRRVWGVGQRPYSYRVVLPSGVGDCFKIIEASYPMHKHTICLPPAAASSSGDNGTSNICDVLAPTDVYNTTAPALYSAIGPIRHPQSTRDWSGYYANITGRLINYVTYHVAMGASGLLLYADELMRSYFGRNPELTDLVRKGHLRLIAWELQERAHNNTDGVGRPLGYNYDQGLTASHALLGLSSCGANLLLLNGDLDEYVYFPTAGRKWPAPWSACMAGAGSPGTFTVHRLHRFETLTTAVPPADEPALWVQPGTIHTRFAGVGNDSAFATSPPGAAPHPLSRYDVVFARALPINLVKQVSLPAAWVVLFWVHEGTPLVGGTQVVQHGCMALLHVANAFRSRRRAAHERPMPDHVRRFRHWMFLQEGTGNRSLWEL